MGHTRVCTLPRCRPALSPTVPIPSWAVRLASGVAKLPRGQARVRARESDPGLSFPFPTSAETAADVFQGHSPRLHRPASLGPPSTTPFLFSLLFRHAGGVASHPAVVPDPTSVSLHPARTLRLHLLGPHAGLHSSEMQARAKSDSPHTELGGKAGLSHAEQEAS